MIPKPKHLGLKYAQQFKDRSVVDAYHHRPPYPPQTFEILSDLITDEPRAVLDIGCGTGYIARNLIEFVERIDAVDFSQHAIDKGKTLSNGNRPNLNWICDSVEEVPLSPPYALITAGNSLHWLEWNVVFPRLKNALSPRGYLTVISNASMPNPWDTNLAEIIPRYSTNQDYQPYNLIEELEIRECFEKHGEKRTALMPFLQSIDEYIETFHAQNGFSRDRMSAAETAAFDAEVKALMLRFCPEGNVELLIRGEVVWGIPKSVSEVRKTRPKNPQ